MLSAPLRGRQRQAGEQPGIALRALVCALAALGLLLATAGPSGAEPTHHKGAELTNKKIKRSLGRQLKKRDYKHVRVSGCSDNNERFICRWYAHGNWPGEVPYKCREKARYMIKDHEWLVPTCVNTLDPQIPLLAHPGPQPYFGYNEQWSAKLGLLPMLQSGGADTARVGLFWASVQGTGPGSFTWGQMDAIYQQMLARGIQPLWVLGGPPCWAQDLPSSCAAGVTPAHPTAGHYDEAAAFAAAAAKRYPQARGIEVGNEPNTTHFWGGSVDPAGYSSLLQQVAAAVHAASPETIVVSGGLASSLSDDNSGLSTATFLSKMYEQGGAQAADAIGIHVYPHKPYGADYIGSVRERLAQEQAIKQGYGEADKPIWITESGISTAGQDNYTEEQQASALVRIFNLYRRVATVPIPVVIIHRFQDQNVDGFPNEKGYGVIDTAGHAKKSFCALAEARGHPC